MNWLDSEPIWADRIYLFVLVSAVIIILVREFLKWWDNWLN